MQLTINDIAFDHTIRTKDSALQQVATSLERAGLTTAEYLQGLRDREAQITTYLGNGIAIPHGTPQSRDAVLRTGVQVLVCPQGVDWGDGQQAQLIVAIAAQDNEHLEILRQLTHVLSDDAVPSILSQATTAQQILDLLSGKAVQAELPEQTTGSFDAVSTFILRDPHGLHARPAAVLVQTVKQWQAEIRVENLDTASASVDAKNLMRMVSLGAREGHRLRFMAKGHDADAALKAIGDTLNGGLDSVAIKDKPKRSWLSRLFS